MAAIQMSTIGFFTSPFHFHRSIFRLVGPIKVHPSRFFTNTKRLLAGRNSNVQRKEQEKEDLKNNNQDDDDDLSYLLKLGVGSVGGAVVIKYGSVLLPEITRPNIVLSLAMIFTPVLVAVILLIKQSSSGTTEQT
ncbi:uncharacterized protein LOC113277825 isoform X2 [Papaver somniferum]|uniref:uncharacterized protein LOC113277825 isoform X2 n=1 Tax=Papaver somniferum TaxID=3469 RepID=UPI000E6F4A80|nr:uncharacterized protein LOC113277825 isoform X2 [Papaver somniferum]